MKRIYLDHAATTKPDPSVLKKMDEVNKEFWGNPSSFHNDGQKAKQMLEDARKFISFFIGCEAEEVVFTSGGTEADNLAIRGVIDAAVIGHNVQETQELTKPHVVTTTFEHHAVLDVVKELEERGLIEATYVKPDSKGLIRATDIEAAIRSNTVLVSVMYVNNEIGTVQPIREIGEMLKRVNKSRKKIYFHVDAVQAVEYFTLSPKYLGIDMLSIAAHKFHGPKGVGALFVRKDTPINHQITGGGQERRKRAGTENVAAIAGMAVALELIFKQRADEGIEIPGFPSGEAKARDDQAFIEETQAIVSVVPSLIMDQSTKKLIELREKLIRGILQTIPDSRLNGDRSLRSPANVNVSFSNAEGESIILMLDLAGISASSGSACTSGSLDPSHVLLSLGLKHEEAHGSVRFSLGRETTEAEIDRVLEVLPPIIERLRKMSPLKQSS